MPPPDHQESPPPHPSPPLTLNEVPHFLCQTPVRDHPRGDYLFKQPSGTMPGDLQSTVNRSPGNSQWLPQKQSMMEKCRLSVIRHFFARLHCTEPAGVPSLPTDTAAISQLRRDRGAPTERRFHRVLTQIRSNVNLQN